MASKEKENMLPQITDVSWSKKSKRRKRAALASTSSVNGSISVSVPQRGEINDPLFQLKGQKMNTQRVVDEQLASTIAMVLLSESTFEISCSPYDKEFQWKELSTKTIQSFIKEYSEISKFEKSFSFDVIENISGQKNANKFPEFRRSLTCDGAGLSPCEYKHMVSILYHIYILLFLLQKEVCQQTFQFVIINIFIYCRRIIQARRKNSIQVLGVNYLFSFSTV